jgi:hypothetical protein
MWVSERPSWPTRLLSWTRSDQPVAQSVPRQAQRPRAGLRDPGDQHQDGPRPLAMARPGSRAPDRLLLACAEELQRLLRLLPHQLDPAAARSGPRSCCSCGPGHHRPRLATATAPLWGWWRTTSQKPLERTEGEVHEAGGAIHRMAASIEHHVQAIDELAISVGPLTESVDQLTATMRALVTLLAPMASAGHEIQRAEQDVARAERFLGFRRQKSPPP